MKEPDPGTIHNLALLSEYDGTAFCGWQIQNGQRTVQQVLRDALIRLTGETDLQLTGCSRTDAGVHARGHVSHFHTRSRIPVDRFPLALNSVLPPDLSVKAASLVYTGFNARFAARAKTYTYRIWNRPARPAIGRNQVCHVPGQLDLTAVRQTLPILTGCHDFKAFRDTGGNNRSTVRNLFRIELAAEGPLIVLTYHGDGFLYHMVRVITGTLVAVAQGKLTPEQVAGILAGGDRRLAGKTMPPQGLCLEEVFYDPPLFADRAEQDGPEGDHHAQSTLE